MMPLLILIAAIIFYLLGRWSVRSNKDDFDTIDEIVHKAKTVTRPKVSPGIIPFKTQEQFEAEKSGEKALEDHWEKSGIADLIRGKK